MNRVEDMPLPIYLDARDRVLCHQIEALKAHLVCLERMKTEREMELNRVKKLLAERPT